MLFCKNKSNNFPFCSFHTHLDNKNFTYNSLWWIYILNDLSSLNFLKLFVLLQTGLNISYFKKVNAWGTQTLLVPVISFLWAEERKMI